MHEPNDSKIIFGCWALRGKAHVIRLLMEHLEIPYENIVYKTPKSWYEDQFAKKNKLTELPYVQDDDFIVNQTIPISNYILKKFGHQNFLGMSIEDKTRVDMHIWSMQNVFRKLISMSVKNNDSVQQRIQKKEQFWKKNMEPKLKQIENRLVAGEWYLGYLSIIDFDLYQFMQYLLLFYPQKIANFPKIQIIQRLISELPAIRTYNNTQECRDLCFLPVQMCKRFKAQ